MNLNQLSVHINNLQYDFIAEFIVSCLINNEFTLENICCVNDGALKRKWSKDINYAEIEDFDYFKKVLTLHLNRVGIYDSLPEAIFHKFDTEKNNSGVSMAKQSKRLKIEEKNIRLFFKPFENELIYQRVRLALTENKIFNKILSEHLNGLVTNFWNIDSKIPLKYVFKIIKLLPYIKRIIGDTNLIAQSLEFILEENVNIKVINAKNEVDFSKDTLNNFTLGDNSLGYNTIIGDRFIGFMKKMVFLIGPLKMTNICEYLNGGDIDNLLKCFFSFFVPMEYEMELIIIPAKEQRKLVLANNSEQPDTNNYLGYNTVL